MTNQWLEDGQKISGRYQEKIRAEGLQSPKSLGYRTDTKEISFFDELIKGIDFGESVSILDIGCGKGEFINYFGHAHPEVKVEQYLGIDIVPEFINLAAKEHSRFDFELVNFIAPGFTRIEKFELVIALGVLISRVTKYEKYIEFFINKMLDFSSKYVAFNFISKVTQESPNYINAQRVGHSTSITISEVEHILSKIHNIDFIINSQSIFFDADDSFVQITKR